MKIVFIHYHLKTGGVTTVLKQQVESVRDKCEVLVFTGKLPEAPFPAETVHIPGLGYYDPAGRTFSPDEVVESIIRSIFLKWKDGCDLIHVHNPFLAKNKILLKILKRLQKRGIKLFLQAHDFAEDGRPDAYFPEEYISNCHYGAINSRDYNILLQAGLNKEGLHKIFNAVIPFNFNLKKRVRRNYVLYPVRAIRRKNIGEAILLSLFFRNKETLAITLPPNSAQDIKIYEGWKDFAKEKNLNIEFDAGLHYDFAQLVLSSKFLLTTSITEGFGFSYLEPWTGKKVLWGRKLTDICIDFEKNGIKLDHLYSGILVPINWIGKERFYEKWKASVLKSFAQFNFTINEKKIENSFAKITKNNHADFGLLDEIFQKQIISKIISDRKKAEKMICLNPHLSNPGYVSNKEELIQNNMNAVQKFYSEQMHKKRLMEIYTRVVNNQVYQKINKKILLSHFLNLKYFSLLKWGDYVG